MDDKSERVGKKDKGVEVGLEQGNKSLTSSAHCTTLTLLSSVNQWYRTGFTFNGRRDWQTCNKIRERLRPQAVYFLIQSIYNLNESNSAERHDFEPYGTITMNLCNFMFTLKVYLMNSNFELHLIKDHGFGLNLCKEIKP